MTHFCPGTCSNYRMGGDRNFSERFDDWCRHACWMGEEWKSQNDGL